MESTAHKQQMSTHNQFIYAAFFIISNKIVFGSIGKHIFTKDILIFVFLGCIKAFYMSSAMSYLDKQNLLNEIKYICIHTLVTFKC